MDTSRLLQFPATLEKELEKMMDLKNRLGGGITQVFFDLINFQLISKLRLLLIRTCMTIPHPLFFFVDVSSLLGIHGPSDT
jgi:hypothetical protein